jgi:opacity protein-like surface antigen
MSMLTRGLPMLALGVVALTTPLAAQDHVGTGSFKWYVGAAGGATIFETTAQTDKAAPMGSAQFFVTARRTALRISYDEIFSSDNLAVYEDPTAPGGVQQVSFNNIRRINLLLMGVPLQGAFQPYIGLGVGWMWAYNPQVLGSPSDPVAAQEEASARGSVGYASGIGGLQWRFGKWALFGYYQITSSPDASKYFQGPTHTFAGGFRFSLGPSRETF